MEKNIIQISGCLVKALTTMNSLEEKFVKPMRALVKSKLLGFHFEAPTSMGQPPRD
jgi:hypothetical protein